MAAWVAAWVVVPVVGPAFQEAAQVVVLVAALAAAALRQLVQPWLGELWLVRLVQLVGRSLGLQVWLEVGWALAWVAGWVVVEAEAALMEAGREAVAELQLCWPPDPRLSIELHTCTSDFQSGDSLRQMLLLLLLLELGRAPPVAASTSNSRVNQSLRMGGKLGIIPRNGMVQRNKSGFQSVGT